MLHLRSQVLHGMVGGLAAGFVVAMWFFVVDLFAGQRLQTPVLLARIILGIDNMDGVAALASPQLILGYTVIHFTVFALLGAAAAIFMAVFKLTPSVRLGAGFGVAVLSGLYYLVLLITGGNVLGVLPAAHVLGANLLGGVALMLYLHRANHAASDFGPEVLKHHRLVTEGLITGLYGAAAVAVAFLVFDALTRQPFFTPAALGSFLFLGASSPEQVRLSFGVVAAYTAVHLLGFSLVGVVFAWSAERLQRTPSMWLIWLLAFIVAEGVFLGTATTSGEWVMGTIGWWAVLMGNIIGVAAMAWRVKKAHPSLPQQIRETVNVKV
jgi:hypothetical protein